MTEYIFIEYSIAHLPIHLINIYGIAYVISIVLGIGLNE
jgi:hypothetical protein